MGIETHWGFTVGSLPHGPRNLISDVPGVTVGHCTLADGDVQTGVTALLPHPGDTFHEKRAGHPGNAHPLYQHPERRDGVHRAGAVYAGPLPRHLRDHRQRQPGGL